MPDRRILSTHGNVTAVDFRPRAGAGLSFTGKSYIVHEDEHTILGRYEFYLNGELQSRNHYLIDRHAGTIAYL
ncbi:hypothetical protein [Phenylobacterium sp.]|uniref:hypothetical protein n=1 Tax=Phenylobacterium sp. TaxID=1871053 RepID=UPI00301C7C0E